MLKSQSPLTATVLCSLLFAACASVLYTPVDRTFRVLMSFATDGTFAPTARKAAKSTVASDGKRVEINVFNNLQILGTAGGLALQLTLFVTAKQLPSTMSAARLSPANGQSTIMGSSQILGRLDGGMARGETITQPGQAGSVGNTTLGGDRHPLYRLSKSDSFDVTFTFSPDFNQTVVVQPDGFVALKGAGTLFCEGLTIPQVEQAVVDAYRGFLHDPEVTVQLKEFDKPYFLASGEVARPGKYELRGDLTLAEAVAIAGGFTQQALHSQVVLFRRVSSNVSESHVIDVKRMLNSHNLQEDMHLRPGDFVYVPQSHISKIRKFVPTNALSWYMNPLQF